MIEKVKRQLDRLEKSMAAHDDEPRRVIEVVFIASDGRPTGKVIRVECGGKVKR